MPILRIKIEMKAPFLYMKFWTNQHKNKTSPKDMYENRTFFLKCCYLADTQCRLQCRYKLKTLYTPGLLQIIWELFAKKS